MTTISTDQSMLTVTVQIELVQVVILVVVAISVCLTVRYVTSILTITIFILQVRLCEHVVNTECLRHVNTQTLTALTRLSSNNDSTVQTARTVKSCCSSTLQYRYCSEVVRVQVLQFVTVVTVTCTVPVCRTFLDRVVKDNTVDNVDRLVVLTQSGSTTDLNLRRTEHTTVRRRNVYTGNLTLQSRYRVHHVSTQIFTLHFSYSVTQGLSSTLHTESGYYDFFQSLSIILQSNVERSTVPSDFLSLITHE